MEDLVKAGKIASEARKYGLSLIKVGASLLEVTEKIEEKIVSLGGKPAFPTQFSVNNITAHYNSLVGDKYIFGKDLVKFDLGVHINGKIADCAISVDLSGKNSKLILASSEALKVAINLAKPGVMLYEIGAAIENTIKEFGFAPVKNLSGHGLGDYDVHSAPTIPNYDNGDKTKLKKGQVIAIEPFASTGEGLVMNGKKSEIYSLKNLKNVRNKHAREILKFINEEYRTLPFSKRAILKKFSKLQTAIGISNLLRENVLHEYSVLVERDSNALVAQTEHTLIVGEKVTTL
jgi:methionyl aminopeptidase